MTFSHLPLFLVLVILCKVATPMSEQRRLELKHEVEEMFYHSYDSYMKYAFPRDELTPLTCGGVDNYGGMTLTLIDTLDTLLVIGNITEFERAVDWVSRNVRFDNAAVISVFEANIRALGGLVSAHLLAEEHLPEYDGGLLEKAVELGDTLLKAFDTPTFIPYNEIHLQHGADPSAGHTTCPAAAGTLMLEFGMLSAITGECRWQDAARRALEAVWAARSKIDLMGTIIDLHTGGWKQADADIGASTDSLYEYLFKSYVVFDTHYYYELWLQAEKAVDKYLRSKNWFIKANYQTGREEKRMINSLQAFWPGLQVLTGDLDTAIASFGKFHCVFARFRGCMPELFHLESAQTPAYGYPLRPEFLESAYYLYTVTQNDVILDIAELAVKYIQKTARVQCGFAAVEHIGSGKVEDKMDSYWLSETLKYLYMIFDTEDKYHMNTDYIFTTEGHPLPIKRKFSTTHAQCDRDATTSDCRWWLQALYEDRTGVKVQTSLTKSRWNWVKLRNKGERSDAYMEKHCMKYTRASPAVLLQEYLPFHSIKPKIPTDMDSLEQRGACAKPTLFEDFKLLAAVAESGRGAACWNPLLKTPKSAQHKCFKSNKKYSMRFSIPRWKEDQDIVFTIVDPAVAVESVPGGVVITGMDLTDLHVNNLPFSVFMKAPGASNEEEVEWPCTTATYGPSVKQKPIKQVPIWFDPINPLACDTFVNPKGASGCAFVVWRGQCPFQRKVEYAMWAGASSVIVINNDAHGILQMASDVESNNASLVTIPSAMISKDAGLILLQKHEEGTTLVSVGHGRKAAFSALGLYAEQLGPKKLTLVRQTAMDEISTAIFAAQQREHQRNTPDDAHGDTTEPPHDEQNNSEDPSEGDDPSAYFVPSKCPDGFVEFSKQQGTDLQCSNSMDSHRCRIPAHQSVLQCEQMRECVSIEYTDDQDIQNDAVIGVVVLLRGRPFKEIEEDTKGKTHKLDSKGQPQQHPPQPTKPKWLTCYKLKAFATLLQQDIKSAPTAGVEGEDHGGAEQSEPVIPSTSQSEKEGP